MKKLLTTKAFENTNVIVRFKGIMLKNQGMYGVAILYIMFLRE